MTNVVKCAYKAIPRIAEKGDRTMKSTGVIRNIDELGRIVVPKEIRKHLGISSTDAVEIFVDGDRIILKKHEPYCCFCNSNENVIEFKGKKICRACLYEIKHK